MQENTEDMILDIIRDRDYVSYAELDRLLGESAKGNLTVIHPEDSKIIFWGNMSADYANATVALMRKGLIEWEECKALVYMMDGKMMGFPRVIRPPKGGYKNPHWLPVVLRPIKR